MFISHLLEEWKYFLVADGKLYLPQEKGNCVIESLPRKTLVEKSNIIDAYNSYKGYYSTLETALDKVLLPYLQESQKDKGTYPHRFFPGNTKEDVLLITPSKVGIFSNQGTQKPTIRINDRKVSLRETTTLSSIEEYFTQAETKKRSKRNIEFSIQKNDRYCTIKDKLPPFIMKNTENERFLFSGLTIAIDIQNEGGKYVIKRPYEANGKKHPFVFSSKDICLGKKDFQVDNNIKTSHKKISFKLINDISAYMLGSRSVITTGYNEGVNPVNTLTKKEFKREFERAKHAK